ncbi:MAG: oligosaccharide flippase family protein, partial [Candidatus Omnitrophica bacterium]|nr:oligosaccharide flippase family protein [Candidatus Omnitrophota bacterium]
MLKKCTDIVNGFIEKLKDRLGKNEKVIVKGTGAAFLGICAFNISSFFLLLAKTRLMPASDVGLIVLAKSIVLTAFILGNGFSGAVFRYASIFRGERARDRIKGVVVVAYRYVVPILFLIFLLITAFAGHIAVNIFHKPQLVILIRILALMVFFKIITNINAALLRSKYLVQYYYFFDVGVQLLMLLLVFILFVFGQRNFLIMFAVAWTVAQLFVMTRSFFIVKREFPFVFDGKIKSREYKKKFFLFAFVTQITSILIRFRLEISIFIIGFFLLTSDIALYNVALQMGMAAGMLVQGLNSIFPAVTGVLYGQDRIREIRKLHSRTAGILLAIALLVFIFFLLFGRFILGIFGTYYVAAYIPLLIIAFSFIIESGVGPAGRILNMMGKPQYNTVNTLIGLAMTVVLCYTLIPGYKVAGAAVAFAASNIVKRLLMLGEVRWLY